MKCPRDVTAEVLGVSGRGFAGMPVLTRNRFGCGTDWYPAGNPEQAGRTTRMDFILAEVDLATGGCRNDASGGGCGQRPGRMRFPAE